MESNQDVCSFYPESIQYFNKMLRISNKKLCVTSQRIQNLTLLNISARSIQNSKFAKNACLNCAYSGTHSAFSV